MKPALSIVSRRLPELLLHPVFVYPRAPKNPLERFAAGLWVKCEASFSNITTIKHLTLLRLRPKLK